MKSVVILAGGKSKRMGQDKATIKLGGKTLLERVVGRLYGVADECVIVSNEVDGTSSHPALKGRQITWTQDLVRDMGPLGGIQAGLTCAKGDRCLVVACDMPFVSRELAAQLLGFAGYDAVVPEADGRLQPLHSVYSRECLPAVEGMLCEGSRRLMGLLERVDARILREDEMPGYSKRWFFNVNEPADLITAEAMLDEEEG